MKSIFTYLAGFSLLSLTAISCSKESHTQMRQPAQTPQVVNATVPAGETYVLNLGAGSTASIEKQAKHYQVSEITTAPNGTTDYKYTAAKGFAGADEVTLQQAVTYNTMTGVNCSRGNTDDYTTTTTYKTIVVKLNVAN